MTTWSWQPIEERYAAVEKWQQIYLDDFIPFAHGVRQLGIYYNDAVQPEDPYEFVRLLKDSKWLPPVVTRPSGLAEQVRADPALRQRSREPPIWGGRTHGPRCSRFR